MVSNDRHRRLRQPALAVSKYNTNIFISVSKEEITYEVAHLVFEGVDTVAFIELNDSPIGTTDNMFIRYTFDVSSHIKVRE